MTTLTKKCRLCKIEKPILEFSKQKNQLDGFRTLCKVCKNQENINYRRTKEGAFTNMWSNQRMCSKARKMPLPNYTKIELIDFCYKNNFDELFDNWAKNDFIRWLRPSIDRLNDKLPYTLENIRLVTWKENMDKAHRDNSRAVIQYDENMNILNEFVSVAEAKRQLGYDIINPLKKGNLNKKGFYFKYK